MISIPSASLMIVVALSGCAATTPEMVADTTATSMVDTTAPSTTATTTTTTPADAVTTTTLTERATTTTAGEPEVLTAIGIVIDVAGDLTETTSVTILDGEGNQIVFIPSDEATFHGGPVSHIRDHVLSGLPVVVDYVVLADGTLEGMLFDDVEQDH